MKLGVVMGDSRVIVSVLKEVFRSRNFFFVIKGKGSIGRLFVGFCIYYFGYVIFI